MRLRHYQESAIEKLREKIRAGLKRIVLVAPTGSGKTRIAGEIIEKAAANGKRVAFICNRIELVNQSVSAFEKLGISCGVMQGQNTWNAGGQVVVCSIQTMARRKFNSFDLLIIDEVHTAAASKAYHSVMESHNNCIVIGLTATPWSKGMAEPKKWLAGEPLFQDTVIAASIPMLVEQGFLSDVSCYAPGKPDLSGVRVINGDYDKGQLAKASDKPKLIGDIVKNWFRLAGGQQTVVFAVNVAHSKHIVDEFVANGVTAKHVDGYMTEEERRPILDAFKNGEFTVLSNCSMLREGWDVPATTVLVMARATKSEIAYIQMAGRVLRPHDSKDFAILLDHGGNVERHGFPTDERDYTLDDGKPKQAKEMENLPKVCQSCFAVYPRSANKCPVCGFAPVSVPKSQEVEAGDLVQVAKKSSKYTQAEKQEIYSALLGWARSKGMRDGAAYHKYKDMIGVYPPNTFDKTPGPMVESVRTWLIHDRIRWAKSQEKTMEMRI